MRDIAIYTASSAGARCAMLGGGIGEHEAARSPAAAGSRSRYRVSAAAAGRARAGRWRGGDGERGGPAAAGSASTRPARSPAAGLRNSPAPYSVAAGYLIPNGPGGEPWPTRLRPHRIPYPYSAPDGPSGHCPAAKTTVLAHRALPAPRPPFPRRCFGLAARYSRFRCVPGRAGRHDGRRARRHPGHLARAAGEVIATLVSWLRGYAISA